MGRRRAEPSRAKEVAPLNRRIEWLLMHVWGNSITRMAEAVGMSHPALSRVLGGQSPPTKMIQAIAARGDIDIYWLLCGTGEPMITSCQAPRGFCCWVADTLLAGEPRAHPEKLSALSLPFASPFRLQEPYLYPVRDDDPITADKLSPVIGGDYLLIETSTNWICRPEAYMGLPVVLRTADEETVILGRVASDEADFEDEPQYNLDCFGALPAARLFPYRTRESLRAILRRPAQSWTTQYDSPRKMLSESASRWFASSIETLTGAPPLPVADEFAVSGVRGVRGVLGRICFD